jgi:hypothetical protein
MLQMTANHGPELAICPHYMTLGWTIEKIVPLLSAYFPCVCVCIPYIIFLAVAQGTHSHSSEGTRNCRRIFECLSFYVVYVVSKERRRLVFPRTFVSVFVSSCAYERPWCEPGPIARGSARFPKRIHILHC